MIDMKRNNFMFLHFVFKISKYTILCASLLNRRLSKAPLAVAQNNTQNLTSYVHKYDSSVAFSLSHDHASTALAAARWLSGVIISVGAVIAAARLVVVAVVARRVPRVLATRRELLVLGSLLPP
jgi:hypothetical protein